MVSTRRIGVHDASGPSTPLSRTRVVAQPWQEFHGEGLDHDGHEDRADGPGVAKKNLALAVAVPARRASKRHLARGP